MGTERSDRIYEQYLLAADKFDYYIVAIAVTLVGYLGSQLEPTRISLTSSGLGFVAALLFLGSAFAGFKRIEKNVTLLKMMHRRLYDEEVAGAMAELAVAGRSAINTLSGKAETPETALQKSRLHKRSAEKVAELLEDTGDRSVFWGYCRNWLLLGGLLVLMGSRILPAYLN